MNQATFEALGVSSALCEVLAQRGITTPFPIQELCLPDAIAGRDVCGKAKTGSGKTLAFGLPVIMRAAKAKPRRPTALMLVPTRELALQVAAELEPLAKALGLVASAIYGGADIDRQIRRLAAGLDVLIGTPGRVIDLLHRGELELGDLGQVVIDEADRMADMGFMPQVEWILRRAEGKRQTLLFSATLDGAVDGLVKRYQSDPVHHEVASTAVTVEEMEHRFLKVHQMDKVKVAASIARGVRRTIMFVRTKRGADRLAAALVKEGVRAAPIHGDLRQSARERTLEDFSSGKLPVLVATDVAARGLHIDDVDVVVHYDPAEDHKAYLHRSGRTARAGESGVAVTLMLWDEELDVKRLHTRLGVRMPIVEVFSNDPRLADLAGWDPSAPVGVAS
ncbi:MAG: DEAD/DEAH box helicase [Acidimicrobiales bacterium]